MWLPQINVPYKNYVDEKELARQVKSLENRTEDDRMEVLFTELSTKELYLWMIENDINIETMRAYYEKYILPTGVRNREFEEWCESFNSLI
jgi:hypothetical protein